MARIVVVDDESSIRRLIADLLTEEGHAVLETSNGRAAVDLVRESHPDLILMDIMMPALNGVDAALQIRKLEGMADVPVILMSAIPNSHVRHMERTTFLPKPFDITQLLSAIHKMLAR